MSLINCIRPMPTRSRGRVIAWGVLVVASTVRAQVTVSLVMDDPGNRYIAYHADIQRVFLAAASEWTQHFQGNANLEIEVFFESNSQALMFSAASIGVLSGSYEGSDVYQWGTIVEILEGEDPNGADVDGVIGINPDYIGDMWFDPAPGTSNSNVPANKYDAYSVVLHEFGHVFAFNGWLTFGSASAAPVPAVDDVPTPILRSRGILKCGNLTCRPQAVLPDAGQAWVSMNGYYSPFDTHIATDAGGNPYFMGPNIASLFSDGVPFDAESYTHINMPGSVMYTYAFPGVRDRVTVTELAILADCDVPVTGISACQTGSDSDGDGIDDCVDACPDAPIHIDADLDGVLDCIASPCGDLTDTDGDGYQDCVDACPENPNRYVLGDCGCELCPGEVPTGPNDPGDEVVLGEQPEVPMGGPGCGAGAVGAEMLLMAVCMLMFVRRRRDR